MAEGVPADTETAPDDVPDISPDESLYRRCVPGFQARGVNRPSIRDFRPRPIDVDGLSVTRPRLTSLEQAATCPNTGKKYHVAEITVELLTRLDLSAQKWPLSHDRGHAVIPELNSRNRGDPEREVWMEERAKQLVDNARMVFSATTPPPPTAPGTSPR